MPYGAGRVIHVVVRDKDFLAQSVDISERPEFTVIRPFLGYAIRHLHVILQVAFTRQEVDLFAVVVENVKLVAHIDQLVVYDIFEVMRKVEAVIRATQGIEANVFVIHLGVI